MDPIMEVLCQGLRVCIGIFPIPSPRQQIEGGSSIGLVTRAVRAEVEAEISGSKGRGIQKRLDPSSFLQKRRPLFFLGSANQDDVVEEPEKATLIETQKTGSLSAWFHTEEGGKRLGGQNISLFCL